MKIRILSPYDGLVNKPLEWFFVTSVVSGKIGRYTHGRYTPLPGMMARYLTGQVYHLRGVKNEHWDYTPMEEP